MTFLYKMYISYYQNGSNSNSILLKYYNIHHILIYIQ